jgi:nitrite reductase/ring-hydroxylating ferredoxin subunit
LSKFVKVLSANEVAPGGMKFVEVEGQEIIIGNCDGKFYAVQRRCGHMNAPLEMGTLDGTILTCPMHCAQFDITTGEALAGPVPHDVGNEIPPPKLANLLRNVGMLMGHVKTQSILTYETKVKSGVIWIAI